MACRRRSLCFRPAGPCEGRDMRIDARKAAWLALLTLLTLAALVASVAICHVISCR